MLPVREHVPLPESTSWRFFLRELEALPFEWHHHPEFELTLTLNSRGDRYVGDHIESYRSGDLVLLGPNLPHSWASQAHGGPELHRVYVLWFEQAWLEQLVQDFPEFARLEELGARARRGLVWPEQVGMKLKPLFAALERAAPERRTLLFLDILLTLTETPARQLASARFAAGPVARADQSLLTPVLDRIHADYAQPLTLAELAASAPVSVSTLNRLFRRHLGQSVHQYLTQVRLGNACSDLVSTERPIGLIAEAHGFPNLSNFNRLFQKYRGMRPRAFRQHHRRQDLPPGQSALAGLRGPGRRAPAGSDPFRK